MTKGDDVAAHTVRVRDSRWDAIEKKAWELSLKEGKPIKPTDVVDAILANYTKSVSLDDIKNAKENR